MYIKFKTHIKWQIINSINNLIICHPPATKHIGNINQYSCIKFYFEKIFLNINHPQSFIGKTIP